MGSGSRLLARITGPAKDKRQARGRVANGEWRMEDQTTIRHSPFAIRGLSVVRLQRTWITRAIKPIERLVPVSSTRRRAYTSGLSTWSSSTALKGDLVSRGVSRLDAFSGYPVRT